MVAACGLAVRPVQRRRWCRWLPKEGRLHAVGAPLPHHGQRDRAQGVVLHGKALGRRSQRSALSSKPIPILHQHTEKHLHELRAALCRLCAGNGSARNRQGVHVNWELHEVGAPTLRHISIVLIRLLCHVRGSAHLTLPSMR